MRLRGLDPLSPNARTRRAPRKREPAPAARSAASRRRRALAEMKTRFRLLQAMRGGLRRARIQSSPETSRLDRNDRPPSAKPIDGRLPDRLESRVELHL